MENNQHVAIHDSERVNLHEDHEVRYWIKKFGVSKERLTEAVKARGTAAEDVQDYLDR